MDKVIKSDAEWRAALSPEAYRVTRKHGTERAGTHDNFPKDPGTYRCTCCGAPLFDQAHKFESGTGWPSFWQPVDGTGGALVGEKEDRSFFMRRTEVHCNRCEAPSGPCLSRRPPADGPAVLHQRCRARFRGRRWRRHAAGLTSRSQALRKRHFPRGHTRKATNSAPVQPGDADSSWVLR